MTKALITTLAFDKLYDKVYGLPAAICSRLAFCYRMILFMYFALCDRLLISIVVSMCRMKTRMNLLRLDVQSKWCLSCRNNTLYSDRIDLYHLGLSNVATRWFAGLAWVGTATSLQLSSVETSFGVLAGAGARTFGIFATTLAVPFHLATHVHLTKR